MRFLDNVLQDFIDRAPPGMEQAPLRRHARALRRARRDGVPLLPAGAERAVGKRHREGLEQEDLQAHPRRRRTRRRSSWPRSAAPCPDAAEYGMQERFSHKLAIAPTASISIIAGNSSPGIEPIAANVFLQKTLSGSFAVRNRHLQKLLALKGQDNDEVWSSITLTKGSVQHLDFLTEQEKAVFKTAFELDQRWIIEHAADRAPFICQSQSVNVFLPANVHKRDLHQIHFMAWKKGVKSLYYCRSLSIGAGGQCQRESRRARRVHRDGRGVAAARERWPGNPAAGRHVAADHRLRGVPGLPVARPRRPRPSTDTVSPPAAVSGPATVSGRLSCVGR